MKVQGLLKLLVLSIVLSIQASAMDLSGSAVVVPEDSLFHAGPVCPLPVGYVISREPLTGLLSWP